MTSISSTLVDRADIRFHEAPEALRRYVGCFWVITAEEGATIRLVPEGSTAISIELRNGEPSEWFLRGPLLRPDLRRFESPTIVIGIRLRPGVAHIVSGMAADALVDRRIGLSDIRTFHELVSSRPSPRTPEQCLDALRRFLIDRIGDGTVNVHPIVATAIQEIAREHGCVRVEEIAARCDVSVRHLNRLMRTWVGYGPKRFATVVRFQESLNQMERSPGHSAAMLASATGYFDQAHMTLDLTRYAGATPARLASSCVADFSKTRCDDLP